MSFLIGFPLFIVTPCAIAAWLGTYVRSPLLAFVVTWVMTPLVSVVIAFVFTPVLRAITPPNNDGTSAIILPFYGIVTGVIAGVVASVLVNRRHGREAAQPVDSNRVSNDL